MAIKTKSKKVFSFSEFRGLDKESKHIKVDQRRASNGHNFVIDDGAVKTRPAFKFDNALPFNVEDDKLLERYNFKGVVLYITKKHIYIKDGENVYNEKSSAVHSTGFISNLVDFEGYHPMFNEEKDCLFIFNVDNIYVFSIIEDEQALDR